MVRHVGSPSFGEGITPFTEGTDAFDTIMNLKADDGFTAQLALAESYDIDYGLYQHGALENDPMAVINMHPGELVYGESKMFALMDELIACRIPEHTNTPVADLLQWPKFMLDRYINKYRPRAQKESETVRQMELQLEQSLEQRNKS